MNRLQILDDNDASSCCWRDELIYWCVHRQVGGMQGRPNKDEDTWYDEDDLVPIQRFRFKTFFHLICCFLSLELLSYSYWIGGTLRLIDRDDLLDKESLNDFVMSCQFNKGGFSKYTGTYPDILHSFYSLAWLSLSTFSVSSSACEETSLMPLPLNQINCTLGIREERADLFPIT
jgi:geranylgeranyl transferase type-1 subunit beta